MKNQIKIIIPIAIFLAIGSHFIKTNLLNKSQESTLKVKPLGGDFEIESLNGKIHLHDYKNKVVFLYFGYTFCPDICPTSLSAISKAIRSLPIEEQNQIHGIFITLDPKRDTKERMKEYVAFFHPNITPAIDSKEVIDPIATLYGVSYRINEKEKGKDYYTVDHSTQTFLVNKNGELVEFIQHGTSSEEIAKLLKKYL